MRRTIFWGAAGLLLWTQAGYPAAIALADRRRARRARRAGAEPPQPLPLEPVSLIIAAHDEQEVIATKVADARAQDIACEVIVACDGCGDATAQRAREAGADLVLELPRGGKIRAQDAAVTGARGAVVAFSDANTRWEPDALRALATALAQPGVGYACGRVHLENPDGGTNQEGLYWRFETWLRGAEARLSSITAGTGAIYATRREAYLVVDPVMGHDLSLPFNLVKRGWRAVETPAANATEKMVPSIEGEFARKRRMMSHTWPIVIRGGLLDLRGFTPAYALMIISHRWLRYASPFLHLALLGAGATLAGRSRMHRLALAGQGVIVVAALGPWNARPALLARYYVLTTASIAAGLYDWLAHGTQAAWEVAEGTR
ncbi:MAG TPA: glycosyltransferase [Solirubrobacteraceae bacterium]|jgi:cellulose synthase/poly-beta-1,6-N-acetylglucosamine synthase-like glycosyltransferase|nr:glycosyltransferase [Solirubrobacteraceae bacterium]